MRECTLQRNMPLLATKNVETGPHAVRFTRTSTTSAAVELWEGASRQPRQPRQLRPPQLRRRLLQQQAGKGTCRRLVRRHDKGYGGCSMLVLRERGALVRQSWCSGGCTSITIMMTMAAMMTTPISVLRRDHACEAGMK